MTEGSRQMEWTYRIEDGKIEEWERVELDRIMGILDKGLKHAKEELQFVGEGHDAFVYGTGRLAAKIGINLDRYLTTGDVDMASKPLQDGTFMRRFEGRLPMPRLYAYSDSVVIMERVYDPLVVEMVDVYPESEQDHPLVRAFHEMFAKVFVEERVLFLDYHDENVFVNEEDMSLRLIDFGILKEFGADEEERYQTLLAELREVGAREFHRRYTGMEPVAFEPICI